MKFAFRSNGNAAMDKYGINNYIPVDVIYQVGRRIRNAKQNSNVIIIRH